MNEQNRTIKTDRQKDRMNVQNRTIKTDRQKD